MEDFSALPDFDSLPYSPDGSLPGCAWKLFDHNRQADQLGTLNLLTQDKVLDAARRKSNVRSTLQHRILDLSSSGMYASDEHVSFCPQHGSHWDTPLHFAHQKSKKYYNGLGHQGFHSQNALHQGTRLWSARGGICGRGVLLDWAAWAAEHNVPYHPIGNHKITVAQLEEVANWQKTTLSPGDILFLRTGFVSWCNTAATDDENRRRMLERAEYSGVEASIESCRWHWNHHFSAVVSDTITYEAWPTGEIVLHEYFLAMWGMPIGKLWDLEKLSEVCRSRQRWSFFLTSAPLNVASAVGSPPNALAIF
ncbi:hypothetical protein A1O3_01403 [Capronia epimyces CBS 606.96]|uniref:Cyclase n=1 Tax=Capronia epimyces CBS 606.96 TaxID=1182542 RepID=W9ZEE5_9EURO|nr:uncharacterized protein A1O3_01403 [Capronia epimyces CBS 606.96]EXJ92849.1 hypothetical protein A1O3_01403 [Capronia epimyces CBS 606.96]